MTLVMIWGEAADQGVWVVSDSRLSRQGAVGRQVLTDRAAKIISIRTTLLKHTGKNGSACPIATNTLGFAYTGSTLIALQAFAAVGPLWDNLFTVSGSALPVLSEYVKHLKFFVSEYSHDVCAADPDNGCQCVLLGWDHEADGPSVSVIESLGSASGVNITVQTIDLGIDCKVEAFGSGAEDIHAQIAAFREADTSGATRRTPLRFLRQFLKSSPHLEVDGGVQVGFLSRNGFQLYADAQPISLYQPPARIRYRGFDLQDYMQVGDALVNLPSIA